MQLVLFCAMAIGNPYQVNPYTVADPPKAADEWSVVRNSDPWGKPYTVSDLSAMPANQRLPDVTIYRGDVAIVNLYRPTAAQVIAALAAERSVSRPASPKGLPLASAGETVDPDLSRAGPLPEGFDIGGMKRYRRATMTQALSRIGSFSRDAWNIEKVPISNLEAKWHQSGGMLGINGFRSDVYKNDAQPKDYMDLLPVVNSFGYTQYEQGWTRIWPDGSKFMDVLSYKEKPFEIRTREKRDGEWKSRVVFEDIGARPQTYKGLTINCADCHNKAGSGGYNAGLVPGGDGVLSFPFKALEK